MIAFLSPLALNCAVEKRKLQINASLIALVAANLLPVAGVLL